MIDLWAFENKAYKNGFTRIAGIDEAGRGPLAGPVVSAAVILHPFFDVSNITDSKKLTPKKRQVLFDLIYEHADEIGIGIVDSNEIDRINILKASLLSMAIAVRNLSRLPDHMLIDGIFTLPFQLSQEAVPKGDSLSISIASASIIAKVTRDRIMEKYHLEYPKYGFDLHKGYPTSFHREAVKRYGCSPIHRKTFKGVKEHLNQ